MRVEEQLFIQVYDQFADAIFRHCWFRVSDRERAKDLTQETFVKVWKILDRGESVENMRAYLYRIANNLIIDHYRKKKDVSLDLLQEDGFEPLEDKTEELENFI